MRRLVKKVQKEPTLIEGIMGSVIKKIGLDRRYKESQISSNWGKWVGSAIAAHATPYRVVNQKLIVYVDSSVWLAELNRYYKGWILKRVQTAVTKNLVKEIIFKIGEVPK